MYGKSKLIRSNSIKTMELGLVSFVRYFFNYQLTPMQNMFRVINIY